MNSINIDNMGSFLKDALHELKRYIDSNDLMIISSLLSMMSVILGTKVHTSSGSGSKLYSNIWMMIIAQSGLGSKSTTVNTVHNMILSTVLSQNMLNHKAKIKDYKALSKDEKNEITPPNLKQIMSGQGSTFQGMIKALEKNPHGMLTTFDEAGEFLKKFSKDTESKAALTSLYDQQFYGKSLVGSMGKGEDIYIENPYLSILALTNPHSLMAETIDADYLSGFLNRFSIIEIKNLPPRQPFKTMEPQDFSKFQNTSLRLWDILEKQYSNEKPLTLKVDKIQAIYKEWYHEMNTTYVDSEECIQSFLPRQQTASLKYAMIIQVFDAIYESKSLDKMEYIEPKYMKIDFYLAEIYMQSIDEHIKNLADNETSISSKKSISVDKLADKLISYLTHEDRIGKKFTKSQLTNGIRGLSAESFIEALDIAENKNHSITYSSLYHGKTEYYKYYAEKPYIEKDDEEIDYSMLWDDEDVA